MYKLEGILVKTAAVICEYNPFHNGHKHQLDTARSITGCDGIVALMSGNYVQRGDFSVYPKQFRARAALSCGADLILENPAMFTLRSAEGYAYSAVYTLNSLGCIDYLVFGAESDDLTTLKNIAALLVDEPHNYRSALKNELSQGVSYAAARCKAIGRTLGETAEVIIKQPNNLLAVEYLKALIRLNSSIEPVLIRRRGAGHHSEKASGETASASFIRSQLMSGTEISEYVPNSASEIYSGIHPFNPKNADSAILSSLCLCSVKELSETSDISEGLENKIKSELLTCTSLDELILSVKSKRYAYSRIKRSLLCAFLRISSADSATLPAYIKILDFNNNGRQILNNAKRTSLLPLAKNASAVLRNNTAMELWKRELAFDRVYEILY